MNGLAQKIIKLRETKRMTQDVFAEKCGLSRSTVARYEAGNITPSFDTLQKIATAFSISTDYFFDKENKATMPPIDDDDIKFAVFGDPDVTDAQFEEIKKIARIIRERDKK